MGSSARKKATKPGWRSATSSRRARQSARDPHGRFIKQSRPPPRYRSPSAPKTWLWNPPESPVSPTPPPRAAMESRPEVPIIPRPHRPRSKVETHPDGSATMERTDSPASATVPQQGIPKIVDPTDLNYIRNTWQFQELREAVHRQPDLVVPGLQQMADEYPWLFGRILEDREHVGALLKEDLGIYDKGAREKLEREIERNVEKWEDLMDEIEYSIYGL